MNACHILDVWTQCAIALALKESWFSEEQLPGTKRRHQGTTGEQCSHVYILQTDFTVGGNESMYMILSSSSLYIQISLLNLAGFKLLSDLL